MGTKETVIVWAILGIAAIVMLIKKPASLLGFLYGIGWGVFLAMMFIAPQAYNQYDMQIAAIGAGYGSIFGLFFAFLIHEDGSSLGMIIAVTLVLPILMFIIGFVLFLILGLGVLFATGQGGDLLVSVILIGAIIGGGGGIVVVILE